LKKFLKKYKTNKDRQKDHSTLFLKILSLCEKTIEHNLFKPISLTIIISFLVFRIYNYFNYFINDYWDKRNQEISSTPVKININDVEINFSFEEDQIFDKKIKSGDNLLKILTDLGVSEQDVFSIINSLKKFNVAQNLSIGDQLLITYRNKLNYPKNNNENLNRKIEISQIEISLSANKNVIANRNSDGTYQAREEIVQLTRSISRYYGSIKKGLFVDGVNAGISPTSMMNMINLYGYDIDFQRDLQKGDKFEMLVESFYNEQGKKIRDGNVLYSSIMLSNRSIDIYLHKIEDRLEYFDAKGNSVKKSLLRTPVNGARISSGFGMRRHPILGYSKMHKGADFAAPTGTPIMAAGSGTIVYMGVKGGYGNYVQIKHNPEYSTAYGHASRFNKKFRVGAKVKQGDIVAYVGSTGRSTGPHLHFEVIFKGSQVNPAKVKATSGIKLAGKELNRFELSKAEIDKYRRNIPNLIKK